MRRTSSSSTPGQRQLDAAVALFRHTPGASNWRKLETAMTARQDEYNIALENREKRMHAEREVRAAAAVDRLPGMGMRRNSRRRVSLRRNESINYYQEGRAALEAERARERESLAALEAEHKALRLKGVDPFAGLNATFAKHSSEDLEAIMAVLDPKRAKRAAKSLAKNRRNSRRRTSRRR